MSNGGYDPEEWTGFAFGMGVERPALLKHNIDDIRYLTITILIFASILIMLDNFEPQEKGNYYFSSAACTGSGLCRDARNKVGKALSEFRKYFQVEEASNSGRFL